MKKRFISLLLLLAMLLTMLPVGAVAVKSDGTQAAVQTETKTETKTAQEEEQKQNPFQDVASGDWFFDAVQYARVNGFFSGTSATMFTPNGTMTRGMFVTVLGRMAGVDPTGYSEDTGFSDVPANIYYCPYVKWAEKYGITGGTGAGKFSPDAYINREQMATFFVRYFEVFNADYDTGVNITTTPADIDAVSAYARESVLKLWKTGLLGGDGISFNPKGNATRAQAAMLCMRTDAAVKTWYKELGVPSERVKIDPADAQKPAEETKPSGGGSGGGSSSTTYYQVTFKSCADASELGAQTAREGTRLSAMAPEQIGFICVGLFYDQAKTKSVGSDSLSQNITLYADMAAVTPLSEGGSPNYVSSVDAEKTFFITLTSNRTITKSDIKVIDISNGKQDVTNDASDASETDKTNVTITDGTVKGSWKEGETYQLEVLSDDVFIRYNGEQQDVQVRFYNFTIKKDDVKNLQLQKGITSIPAASVHGLSEDAQGLYLMDANAGTTAANTSTGTFTYNGDRRLQVGDIVSIYEGTAPEKRKLDSSDNGDVAYVEITAVGAASAAGTEYSYRVADTQDVLFTPDVLPIDIDANDGTTGWTQAADGQTATISVENAKLNFSGSTYAELGLNGSTTVDVGDFLAFYTGDYGSGTMSPSYGQITQVTAGESATAITYTVVGADTVIAAMDMYSSRNEAIEITDAQKKAIEQDVKTQALESGFIEEAASYLTALALETDGFKELSDDMNLQDYRVTFADGTAVSDEELALMGTNRAEIVEKELHVSVGAGGLRYFEGSKGVRVELAMKFTVEISPVSGSANKLVLSLEAVFEQEVMLDINVSGGAIWKWAWIIPYIYDYRMNANIDVGAYTGIGVTATARTQGPNDPDGFDWKPITNFKGEQTIIDAGKAIINIGEQIEDLMKEKDKFLGNTIVDENGEEVEWTGIANGGLEEKYSAMMEGAEESWIDLFRVELFADEGFVDIYHILVYGVSADFVVQTSVYITMGMSFEYANAKRYNFSIMLFHRQSTNETIDLEPEHYQFDFYVMGTLGLKAGIELEVAVGLFSLKLDSIGVQAQVGAYAQLWGFFYYSLSAERNPDTNAMEKDSSYSGAMLVEIGVYLEIKFLAQIGNGALAYNPTLYENKWPLWHAGSQENVFDFDYEEDSPKLSYEVKSVKTLYLPSSLFLMKYMDMKTGDIYSTEATEEEGVELRPKNYDDSTESRFIVTLSNPDFSYDPNGNRLTFTPSEEGVTQASCEVTITWRGAPLTFTSRPISRTVVVQWSDPENERYLSFNSEGGSSVDQITVGVGGGITQPADPVRPGYAFSGWRISDSYEAYHPKTSSARNDRYSYKSFPTTMKEYESGVKGETLTALWQEDYSNVRVEHYLGQINGTYKLDETNIDIVSDRKTDTHLYAIVGSIYSTTLWDEAYDANYTRGVIKGDKRVLADGSAVVKLYYDLRKVNYTFSYGSKASSMMPASSVYRCGASVYAPQLALGGYSFAGWNTKADGSGDPVSFVDGSNNALPAGNTDVTVYAIWKPADDTPYRVEYHLQNTGNDLFTYDNIISRTGETDASLDLAVLFGGDKTPEGFVYHHAEVGNSNDHVTTATIRADGTMVLRVYFTRQSYTATFNSDGGTAVPDASARYGAVIATPTAPTKSGYDFAGWKWGDMSDADAQKTLTATMPLGGMTLTAVWTPSGDTPYTVRHYQQNVENDAYTLKESQPMTGTTGQPTKAAGKEYAGFASAKSFTQATVGADGKTTVDLYYDRLQYTVSFDADGGEGAPEAQTVRHGGTVNKPTQDPTKLGYAFAVWKNGETAWNFSSPVEGNMTLKAAWTIKQYTVSFVTGAGATSVSPIRVDYGAAPNAPTPPTKPGYSFGGWDPALPDAMPAKNLTVNAVWTANKYTVSFSVGEGASAPNPQEVTYDAAYGTLPVPDKTDYTFEGWYLGDALITAKTLVKITEDSTLTARWQRSRVGYTVKHYKELLTGGYPTSATEIENLTGVPGETAAVTTKTYTGFATGTYNSATIDVNGATVIEVRYARKTGTVIWKDFDGSTVLGQKEFKYDATITPPAEVTAPTREGYTFNRWNAAGKMPDREELVITATAATVSWTEYRYTRSFNSNDDAATGTMASVSNCAYTASFVMPDCAFVSDGKVFQGWSTTPDGDVAYHVGQSYTGYNLKPANNATVTFYAVWAQGAAKNYTVRHWTENLGAETTQNEENYTLTETETLPGVVNSKTVAVAKTITGFTAPETITQKLVTADAETVIDIYYTRNSYDVTWDYNDGATEPTVERLEFGAVITKPATDPKWDNNHTFKGWDGFSEGALMGAAAVTYTAQWEGRTLVLNYYDLVGVSPAPNPQTIKYGQQVELAAPTNIPAYFTAFAGWYGDEGHTTALTHIPSTPPEGTSMIKVYATWVAKPYTIELTGVTCEDCKAKIREKGLYIEGEPDGTFTGTGYAYGSKGLPFPSCPQHTTKTWLIQGDETQTGCGSESNVIRHFVSTMKGTGDTITLIWTPEATKHSIKLTNLPQDAVITVDGVAAKPSSEYYNSGYVNYPGDIQRYVHTVSVPYGAVVTVDPGKVDDQGSIPVSGWYSDTTLVSSERILSFTARQAETFTCQWAAELYHYVQAYDGTTLKATQNNVYANYTAVSFAQPAAPSADYRFAGWKIGGTEIIIPNGGKLPTLNVKEDQFDYNRKTVKLYAQWLKNPKAVYYTDGDSTKKFLCQYSPGTETTLPNLDNKTGYVFTGWTNPTEGIRTPTLNMVIPTTATTEQNLVANWREITYNIQFMANDDVYVTSQAYRYTEAITLPTTKPTRDGYEFVGWYTAETEGKPVYTGHTRLSATDREYVKVYAHWRLLTYNISVTQYHGPGMYPSYQLDTYSISGGDKTVKISHSQYVPEGYMIDHWGVQGTYFQDKVTWKSVDNNAATEFTIKAGTFGEVVISQYLKKKPTQVQLHLLDVAGATTAIIGSEQSRYVSDPVTLTTESATEGSYVFKPDSMSYVSFYKAGDKSDSYSVKPLGECLYVIRDGKYVKLGSIDWVDVKFGETLDVYAVITLPEYEIATEADMIKYRDLMEEEGGNVISDRANALLRANYVVTQDITLTNWTNGFGLYYPGGSVGPGGKFTSGDYTITLGEGCTSGLFEVLGSYYESSFYPKVQVNMSGTITAENTAVGLIANSAYKADLSDSTVKDATINISATKSGMTASDGDPYGVGSLVGYAYECKINSVAPTSPTIAENVRINYTGTYPIFIGGIAGKYTNESLMYRADVRNITFTGLPENQKWCGGLFGLMSADSSITYNATAVEGLPNIAEDRRPQS